LFCTSRRLICRKRTVTYQGQYFMINRRVSECDHKCETRNAEPENGTDGSSQTRRNLRVDGDGSAFGPPRVCGSGFWTVLELNRPVFAAQTRTAGGLPVSVANTTHHTVEFVNLCTCSIIYFLSSGGRLLSRVEIDSLKTNLRACLLYATARPCRCG
jgi:hypothetical protein